MKIETPISTEYLRIAELHNESNKPFHEIYSEEEKEIFGEDIETEESIRQTVQTREVLVAKDEKNFVIGYTVFRKKNDMVVWISSLFVDPVHQTEGVGGLLLKEAEVFAVNNDCKLVALETHRDALWAISFYKKHGYEIVNEKVEHYPYSQILDKPPVSNRLLLAKLIG
jgi:ribosomal protein S18 acetylase RimI-like enzyme